MFLFSSSSSATHTQASLKSFTRNLRLQTSPLFPLNPSTKHFQHEGLRHCRYRLRCPRLRRPGPGPGPGSAVHARHLRLHPPRQRLEGLQHLWQLGVCRFLPSQDRLQVLRAQPQPLLRSPGLHHPQLKW